MTRRMILLSTLLMALTLLAGCSYTPARISSEPLIVFDDGRGHDHYDGGGGFCPPGQAKKGRC